MNANELTKLAGETVAMMDEKPTNELDFTAGFVAGWMTNEENSGWRPIETAPKDGTKMLLYIPDPYNRAEVGNYFVREELSHGKSVLKHEGWSTQWQLGFFRGPDPSHWMPLPGAPNV